MLYFNKNFLYYTARWRGYPVRPVCGVPDFINPTQNQLTLEWNADTQDISIASNCNWTATSSTSWLTCTKVTNNVLFVSASKNTDSSERCAIITLKYNDIIATITVTQKNPFNGHEYVDLGLPSGLLWATCNVGANSPEEYGDYYAWGETTTKSDYSSSTSKTYGKSIAQLQSSGIINTNNRLTKEYDVASKLWGGTWRMPTVDEIEELINNTTTTWTTLNGVYGRKVTSKINGNSIFLPAAGYRSGTSLNSTGSRGGYWSSSPYEDTYCAYDLYFSDSNFERGFDDRYGGPTVRPVSEP